VKHLNYWHQNNSAWTRKQHSHTTFFSYIFLFFWRGHKRSYPFLSTLLSICHYVRRYVTKLIQLLPRHKEVVCPLWRKGNIGIRMEWHTVISTNYFYFSRNVRHVLESKCSNLYTKKNMTLILTYDEDILFPE